MKFYLIGFVCFMGLGFAQNQDREYERRPRLSYRKLTRYDQLPIRAQNEVYVFFSHLISKTRQSRISLCETQAKKVLEDYQDHLKLYQHETGQKFFLEFLNPLYAEKNVETQMKRLVVEEVTRAKFLMLLKLLKLSVVRVQTELFDPNAWDNLRELKPLEDSLFFTF